MLDYDEINRLTRLGLSINTAIAVVKGELEEAFEVARAQETRAVVKWCRGKKNIPDALTAVWDERPGNFYLAFDGVSPYDTTSSDFVLIRADVDEVDRKLAKGASRVKEPWHPTYKWKSCGIAYRWVKGLGVTPPLLGESKGAILIVGGMHRFHLAKHYGTKSMPFLVRGTELQAVKALISSAVQTEIVGLK